MDDGNEENGHPAQAAGSHFDLENYISNYTGHTKIKRLMYIAEKSAGSSLELEALRLAADELKRSENVTMLAEVLERIGGRLGHQYVFDPDEMARSTRRAEERQEKLESELNSYKTSLIKESIRMGHADLGDFHYARGDLQAALKSHMRTRDYCTSGRHVVSMCLAVIRTSIELGNYVHVASYVAKAEQTPDVASEAGVVAKLKCASGLAALDAGKFRHAARKFAEAPADLGTGYSDVISPQDVATYGALCGLATFDRSELRAKLLESQTFHVYLELVPEVRELLWAFRRSQYSACLQALGAMHHGLSLDLHLGAHVTALYAHIRRNMLVQYAAPYAAVSLGSMGAAFGISASEMEPEVAALISDGHIAARIDAAAGVVHARPAGARAAPLGTALAAGAEFGREARAALLHAALVRNDLVQRAPRPPRAAAGGTGS